jgi:hypothetical protein
LGLLATISRGSGSVAVAGSKACAPSIVLRWTCSADCLFILQPLGFVEAQSGAGRQRQAEQQPGGDAHARISSTSVRLS